MRPLVTSSRTGWRTRPGSPKRWFGPRSGRRPCAADDPDRPAVAGLWTGQTGGKGADLGSPAASRSWASRRWPSSTRRIWTGWRPGRVLEAARSLRGAADSAIPSALLERLNTVEAQLVTSIASEPVAPAPAGTAGGRSDGSGTSGSKRPYSARSIVCRTSGRLSMTPRSMCSGSKRKICCTASRH